MLYLDNNEKAGKRHDSRARRSGGRNKIKLFFREKLAFGRRACYNVKRKEFASSKQTLVNVLGRLSGVF